MKFLVAFSSPKRSGKTVEIASAYAKAMSAEMIILRVIPDPREVGIVAQLIASDRPAEKAKSQLAKVVDDLTAQGINATSDLRIGQVARTIMTAASEHKADMLFVGTVKHTGSGFSVTPRDPIVSYLVENCPISICLVKRDPDEETATGTSP